MIIEIEIPKEFENHYNRDKFADSLFRILADMSHNDNCTVSGRYELELLEMFAVAFPTSKQHKTEYQQWLDGE